MPEQSIIAWDLETIPDLAAAARMLDLGKAAEADVRQALGPSFPKHPLHKIVCIGALVASRQPEGWRMDALGAPHVGERPEAKLISDFVERIGQLRPQLITFNGHSFDLPVLRYRAMVNRISAALPARRCSGIARGQCNAFVSPALHRRRHPIATDHDNRRIPGSVRLFLPARDKDMCSCLQISFVTRHKVDNYGVGRNNDCLLAFLVFHL